MNDMIIKIQDDVIEITRILNTALTTKEKLEILQGRIDVYMGIEEGSPLEDCKEVLIKVMNSVINDLYLKISEALYQIDTEEKEALKEILDDLPDEQEMAILDKLLDKEEKAAEQKGGGND